MSDCAHDKVAPLTSGGTQCLECGMLNPPEDLTAKYDRELADGSFWRRFELQEGD